MTDKQLSKLTNITLAGIRFSSEKAARQAQIAVRDVIKIAYEKGRDDGAKNARIG